MADDRRDTEIMLDNLVESFPDPIETRISHSVASRFFVTPTFRRIHDVDCDLAIVHRGEAPFQP